MKPVCDHPSYCKTDAKSIYIGQTHHLAYPGHRNNNAYVPSGFDKVRKNWDGLCSYTASANGNHALCNVPSNTHSWQQASSAYKTFMCGQIEGEFTASLGERKGVPARTYSFKIVQTSASSGRYSDVMIKDCAKIGMKPICDHPSYCKGDVNSIYIGQDHHIAYAGHRNNGGYFPKGWSTIARQWDGLCSYTASANGNHALCNVPSNTHSWQHPGTKYKKFMCGTYEGAPFSVKLGAKNGVKAAFYDFQVVKASAKSGKYSDIMIKDCAKIGMKPVCDHPSYCKTDKKALYIGQTHHLAYPGHRAKAHVPEGFHAVSKNWDGICSYTASANGNHALCNIPSNTHSWQNANAKNADKFMCGKVDGAPFRVSLGAKNGVSAQTYDFQIVKASSSSGRYSTVMVKDCAKVGMKPVCDHPSYCKTDKQAIYIGQTHHLAYPGHRCQGPRSRAASTLVRSTGTGSAHTRRVPTATMPSATSRRTLTRGSSLRQPTRSSCAARSMVLRSQHCSAARTVCLPANTCSSARRPRASSGKYSDIMVKDCAKIGMKPICDHPSYCKNSKKSIYLGQNTTLPTRDTATIRTACQSASRRCKESGTGCARTQRMRTATTLCAMCLRTLTRGRQASSAYKTFMCGKVEGAPFEASLGAKNGVPARHTSSRS